MLNLFGTPRPNNLKVEDVTPGQTLLIHYHDNDTTATVVEVEPKGRYGPQRGWLMVEHVSDTKYGTQYAGARYEAAIEFCEAI